MKKLISSLVFICLAWVAGAQATWSINGGFSSYSSNNLTLQTNSTTRLTILNSNGNVGIGLANPTEVLDVNGTIRVRSITQNNALTQVLVSDATGRIFWRNVATFADNMGNHSATQNIIPATTNSFNLGSATNTFKDLYLSGILNLSGLTQNNAQNKILAADVAGNVVWRDAASLADNLGNHTAIQSILPGTSNTFNLGSASSTFKDLHLGGNLNLTGLVQDNAQTKILAADATGKVFWRDASTLGSGWSLTGNTGTTDGANFIGTTDNVPLNFRVNNQKAGRIALVNEITFIGYQAGNSNSAGQNTGVGYQALYSNTSSGSDNTAIGAYSLYSNVGGFNNTSNGKASLYSNTTGNNNTANGTSSLYINTTGSGNTAIGRDALFNNATGSYNTALGYFANVSTGALTNATAIGANAIVSASNSLVLGSGANVGIGTSSPAAKLDVVGNVKITDGTQGVGKVLTSDANGLATWTTPAGGASGWGLTGNAGTINGTNFIGTTDNVPLNFRVNNQKAGRIDATLFNSFYGYQAGNANTTGNSNVANGYQALYSNIDGYENTATGYQALYSNIGGFVEGSYNTANGHSALRSNTTGNGNTAIGHTALVFNTTGHDNTAVGLGVLTANTTGYFNTSSGHWSLYSNTTGIENTATGRIALRVNTTGNYNTANGTGALSYNETGNYNTALGYGADVSAGNLTNATAIGANAIVSASNSLILGSGANVGIGTSSPVAKLDVVGNVKITDGTQGVGKVLTSDANGLATWTTPAAGASGWSLTGNAGAVDDTNFIGTTDNVPLSFKVNNEKAGRIELGEFANTFLGYLSGNSNTTGQYNTAFGSNSLQSNTEGYFNTAFGFSNLQSNTTGTANTATGFYSLFVNTTGSSNAAFGSHSLISSTTGDANTAIGVEALFSNRTGGYNTAVGFETLMANETGVHNTAIGYQAGNGFFLTNLNNTTAIGAGATATASNTVRIGDSQVTSIGGQVSWSTLSDGRFKRDIKEDISGLSFIKQLRPVSYLLDNEAYESHVGVVKDNKNVKARTLQTNNRYTGFVAQEVETAVKKSGFAFSGVNAPQNDKDTYSIRYSDFVVPLVKAVQELTVMVEKQQAEIELLKGGRTATEKEKLNTLPEDKHNAVLYQNIPNPFKVVTEIRMQLPVSVRDAKLFVYDMQGKPLTSFEVKERGNPSVKIEGGTLASGLYLYALVADGEVVDIKKMILTE